MMRRKNKVMNHHCKELLPTREGPPYKVTGGRPGLKGPYTLKTAGLNKVKKNGGN